MGFHFEKKYLKNPNPDGAAQFQVLLNVGAKINEKAPQAVNSLPASTFPHSNLSLHLLSKFEMKFRIPYSLSFASNFTFDKCHGCPCRLSLTWRGKSSADRLAAKSFS
jgi:hypothetical protein